MALVKAIMNADTWVTELSSSPNSKGTVNVDVEVTDRVLPMLLVRF